MNEERLKRSSLIANDENLKSAQSLFFDTLLINYEYFTIEELNKLFLRLHSVLTEEIESSEHFNKTVSK